MSRERTKSPNLPMHLTQPGCQYSAREGRRRYASRLGGAVGRLKASRNSHPEWAFAKGFPGRISAAVPAPGLPPSALAPSAGLGPARPSLGSWKLPPTQPCADGAGPSASSGFAARGAPWAWPRPGKRPRAWRRASRTRRPTDDRVVPFLGRPTPSCDARRPRPKGQGWPGAWLCQLAHPMTPHRPALASSPSIPVSLCRDHSPGRGQTLT